MTVRDQIVDELSLHRRLVSARWLAAHLHANLDDIHTALLELQAENRVSSMVDHQGMTEERWGIHLAPREKP